MTCQHEWTGKQVSRINDSDTATTCRVCGMSEDMWEYLRPNGLAELKAEIEGLEIDKGKIENVVHLIAFFVNDATRTDAGRLHRIRKTLEGLTPNNGDEK